MQVTCVCYEASIMGGKWNAAVAKLLPASTAVWINIFYIRYFRYSISIKTLYLHRQLGLCASNRFQSG